MRAMMNSKIDQALPTTRRGFLQLGLMGTATLALGSTIATLTGCSSPLEKNSEFKFLQREDREFFAALIPVILNKSFPGELSYDDAMKRTLLALDDLIYTLQYHNRIQMRQLFDALAIAPIRVVAGAAWADWKDMRPKQVDDFLTSWRDSMIPPKRNGYVALSKLIGISWYAQPESFTATGYPGPPTKIPTPVANKTSITPNTTNIQATSAENS
tara:strand:+ start:110 stop:751 length:642 start_codon:yes stop_codon:yes gene_type:complete